MMGKSPQGFDQADRLMLDESDEGGIPMKNRSKNNETWYDICMYIK